MGAIVFQLYEHIIIELMGILYWGLGVALLLGIALVLKPFAAYLSDYINA